MTDNLDKQLLQDLIEIMGDDMNTLIRSYIEDSHTKLEELAKFNLTDQQNEIYRMAHSLKGSSRNIGAVGFADYCEKIESLARHEQLTEDDFSIAQLKSLFADVRAELNQRFS